MVFFKKKIKGYFRFLVTADPLGLYWTPATYKHSRQAVCANIIIT